MSLVAEEEVLGTGAMLAIDSFFEGSILGKRRGYKGSTTTTAEYSVEDLLRKLPAPTAEFR
jgi:hypothetical protein